MTDEPIMPHRPPEGEHLEVWVVGQPNSGTASGVYIDFPPYRFRWDGDGPERARGGLTPLDAAESFVENIYTHGGGESPWLDGPRLVSRTATYGPWIEQARD